MTEWLPAWGWRETDFSLFPMIAENETQRVWFQHNLRTRRIRVRLSNRYGRTPLPLEQVLIAACDENGNTGGRAQTPVTFDGAPSVTLAPGESLYSDEIPFGTEPGGWIAVSLYIREKTRITCAVSTQSRLLTRMSCQKGGNFCAADTVQGERFLDEAREFLLLKPLYQNVFAALTQVDFLSENPEEIACVCAFGDSITQHGHWSEALAKKLYAAAPGKATLFNRGVCGNRVLHDASIRSKFGGYFGEGALERFEEDVFGQAVKRPDRVLIEEGINDIIQPYDGTCPQYEGVTAAQIVNGYRSLAALARARGSGVLGTTVTPFRGFNTVWNGITSGMRRQINETLQTGGIYDALADFSGALADPEDPEQIAREYNCGDNLHPNAAGGEKLAGAFDINWILQTGKE